MCSSLEISLVTSYSGGGWAWECSLIRAPCPQFQLCLLDQDGILCW